MALFWCYFVTAVILIECGPVKEYVKENEVYYDVGDTEYAHELFQALKEVEDIKNFEPDESFSNDKEKNYLVSPHVVSNEVAVEEPNVNFTGGKNDGVDPKISQEAQELNEEHIDKSKEGSKERSDSDSSYSEEYKNKITRITMNTPFVNPSTYETIDEQNSSGSGSGTDEKNEETSIDDTDLYLKVNKHSTTTATYDTSGDDLNNRIADNIDENHLKNHEAIIDGTNLYTTEQILLTTMAKDVGLIDESISGGVSTSDHVDFHSDKLNSYDEYIFFDDLSDAILTQNQESGSGSDKYDRVDNSFDEKKKNFPYTPVPEMDIIHEGSGSGSGSGSGDGFSEENVDIFTDDEDFYIKMTRGSSSVNDTDIIQNGSGSGSQEIGSGDDDGNEEGKNYFDAMDYEQGEEDYEEEEEEDYEQGEEDYEEEEEEEDYEEEQEEDYEQGKGDYEQGAEDFEQGEEDYEQEEEDNEEGEEEFEEEYNDYVYY
ncbi:hypothetical protein Zmor_023644 [Zophobas morio]|uniref:Uncharacterized protein n=1 Tax=Zophobas morio TaxID=2755281 RepID=A0AA38HX97_9CUCU|nr:hypothetical protein Zmor_023644 [Zophobas morio]